MTLFSFLITTDRIIYSFRFNEQYNDDCLHNDPTDDKSQHARMFFCGKMSQK